MKKVMMRVFALALCVFVLTAGTPFFVFAEPGLQEIPACTEPGGHVFDEYKPTNEGTHIAVCSLCGGEFELACVYADPPVWTDQGNGTHGTVCTFCGGLKTEPSHADGGGIQHPHLRDLPCDEDGRGSPAGE